jgi:hypothetical protein
MKNLIVFPGGAGGNWLTHLIACLEQTATIDLPKVNYHKSKKTELFKLSHDHDNTSGYFFNGKALFNMYLNVMKKLRKEEMHFDAMCIEDRFDLMASEASSKLFFYGKKIDLNWDDIFKNKQKFVEDLYKMLDNCNIRYTKNDITVFDSIDSYKETCVDPEPIFNNFDDELWLGWCNGVMKHEFWDWKIVNSKQEAQDRFYLKREYFCEYSLDKFIKINE